VDLYGNAAPARRAGLDEAIAAYNDLEDRRALADLDEAHEFAMSDDVPWVSKAPVGLLGLDVGGRFALLYVATRPDVASVAVVSAPLAGDQEREHQVADALGRLRVPVLGLYGAEDDLVPAESVDTAQQMNPAGRWLLYEGAGHDFFNVGESGYHAGAASDATARLVSFFSSTLAPPQLEEVG
jgi:carboxymethylenebutenolidase